MHGWSSHVAEAFCRGSIHKGRAVDAARVSRGIRWGGVGSDDGGDLLDESVSDVSRDVCRYDSGWYWGCPLGLSASEE